MSVGSFRPLDGESISKRDSSKGNAVIYRFRPLDGESISKQVAMILTNFISKEFPSPRRGINF